MTPGQIAHRTDLSLDCSSYLLWELSVYRVVRCLNEDARRSRLFWLTRLGLRCRRLLHEALRLPRPVYDLPAKVDWELYGWVCYSHRSAVIKALREPLQPSEIKRRACSQNPELRMSANNVRDVIRLLLARGVVRAVRDHRRAHPQYELTEVGKQLQTLLLRAESFDRLPSNLSDPMEYLRGRGRC